MPLRSLALCLLLGAAGCATPAAERVAPCAQEAEFPPLPDADCFYTDEATRYARRLAETIGASLSGWHSGSATLSVAFGADGRVGSLCYGEATDQSARRGMPRAAYRARRLPAAPTCLAGHRLDFAWESDGGSAPGAWRARRDCRDRIAPTERELEFCELAQDCDSRTIERLLGRANRELQGCLLERSTVSIRAGGRSALFRPAPTPGPPDAPLTVEALRLCEGLPTARDGLRCMAMFGWAPVDEAPPE